MSTSSSAASIKIRSRPRGGDGGGVEAADHGTSSERDVDNEDIFSKALPKIDSEDFRPDDPPVTKKKKKTGVLRKVGNALFGKRKKKPPADPPATAAAAPTKSSPVTGNDYSNFFAQPEQWPDDIAAGGTVFSALTASEEPSSRRKASKAPSNMPALQTGKISNNSSDLLTGTPLFFDDDLTPSNEPLSSAFPPRQDSAFSPLPTFNRLEIEDSSPPEGSSNFEKPIVHLSQPLVVRPEPRKKTRWFAAADPSPNKGPSKEELKKREKRITYLRQAQKDLDEASKFGLDSMGQPMMTLEAIEAEEERKLRALLRETREGFEEFLNEFCKAVFARHGVYCIWRLSALKTKYSSNIDLSSILTKIRNEEFALYSNAIEIFNELAVTKKARNIEWQKLCAQDAAMLTKIFIVKSQCLNLVRRYFSEESDVITLTPEKVLGDAERNWLEQRDLNVNQFNDYASEKMDSLNVIERSEFLLKNVCAHENRSAIEEHKILKNDLQRLEDFITTLIDQNLDKKTAVHLPISVNNVLSSYSAKFPSSSTRPDVFSVIRKVVAEEQKRGFGIGFCVESDSWDRQDLFSINKWMAESVHWQSYDLIVSQKIYKDMNIVADLRESKRKYLRQCLMEKLAALWAKNSLRIQEESIQNLVDSLETTCDLGSSSRSTSPEDERRSMQMEDCFGRMQLAWYQQYRDTKVKSFKTPLKNIDQVSQIHQAVQELLEALQRDSSLLKDLELQTVLDAMEQELNDLEGKKKSLRTKHAAQDQSLSKSIEQCRKKKAELVQELRDEEEKADHLDLLKAQYDTLTAEVDELKETLNSLKAAIKIKKTEKHSTSKNMKLSQEVETLTKSIDKQTAILQSYPSFTPPPSPSPPVVPEATNVSDPGTTDSAPHGLTPPIVVRRASVTTLIPQEHSGHISPTKKKNKLGGLFGKVVKAGRSSKSSKHQEGRDGPISDGEISHDDDDEDKEDDDRLLKPHEPDIKSSEQLSVKTSPHRKRSRSVAILHPSAILEALGIQDRRKSVTAEDDLLTLATKDTDDKLSKTTLTNTTIRELEPVPVPPKPGALNTPPLKPEVLSAPPTPSQNRLLAAPIVAPPADVTEDFDVTAHSVDATAEDSSDRLSQLPVLDEDQYISDAMQSNPPLATHHALHDSLTITESEQSMKPADRKYSKSSESIDVPTGGGPIETDDKGVDGGVGGAAAVATGTASGAAGATRLEPEAESLQSTPVDLGPPKILESPEESEQLPFSFSLSSQPLVQLTDVPPRAVPPIPVRRSWSNHSFGEAGEVPKVSIIPSSPTTSRRFAGTDQQTRSDDDQNSSVSLSVSAVSELGEKKKRNLWKKLLHRGHKSSKK